MSGGPGPPAAADERRTSAAADPPQAEENEESPQPSNPQGKHPAAADAGAGFEFVSSAGSPNLPASLPPPPIPGPFPPLQEPPAPPETAESDQPPPAAAPRGPRQMGERRVSHSPTSHRPPAEQRARRVSESPLASGTGAGIDEDATPVSGPRRDSNNRRRSSLMSLAQAGGAGAGAAAGADKEEGKRVSAVTAVGGAAGGGGEDKPKMGMINRLDEEERPLYIEEGQSGCALNPFDPARINFDLLMLLSILYVAIVAPLKICFDVPHETVFWFTIDRFVDVLFITDIVFNFFTAHEENAVLIIDGRRNAIHYLKTWFLLDLVSSIPLEFIFFLSSGASSLSVLQLPRLLRIIKIFKLFRLVRLLKLLRIFTRLEESLLLRFSVMTILKFFFFTAMWCHWTSCVFYVLARSSFDQSGSFFDDSWVVVKEYEDASVDAKYAASFYFAMSTVTTIGYGDITGKSRDERIFCIFAMLMGASLFAYGITNIIEIYSQIDEKKNRFRLRMDRINMFIKENKLPPALKQKIREYFLFMKRHHLGMAEHAEEKTILSELSTPLLTEVTNYINRDILSNIPFLQGCNPYFTASFISFLQPRFYSPGEVIIKEGTYGRSMFILNKGLVEVTVKSQRVARLEDGSVFGEIALLGIVNKRTATIRTLTCCDMRVISRTAFNRLLAQYPDERKKFEIEAQRKLQEVTEIAAKQGGGPPVISPKDQEEQDHRDRDEWLQMCSVYLPRLSHTQLSKLQMRMSAEMLLRVCERVER
ncbi:unnamed protein product [Vitrella brassicaformis CCMP3155]|uniref:Cyclic nucleotide-binding domain-containing protein n=3 Tax=Vitrella brassicaformis TaxID=1169539 RepID=A0A0G4F0E6_VITBC|nr:unnamed protein product [Vitrella brassicaformis CCMP3155]|eukprot:CEM05198.1 unnamed protein product [Vitrella brassicaformis CCMP3155]